MEKRRALNGIVCTWRSSKIGVPCLGVPGDRLGSVSLSCGQDFDCVSVTVWPCGILLENDGLWRCSLAPVSSRRKAVRSERAKLSFSDSSWVLGVTLFLIFHNPRRA